MSNVPVSLSVRGLQLAKTLENTHGRLELILKILDLENELALHITYVIIESALVDSPSGNGLRRTSMHDFVPRSEPPKDFPNNFQKVCVEFLP